MRQYPRRSSSVAKTKGLIKQS